MSHPVDRLPPSAKAIRLALLYEGELTTPKIMDLTRLPERTTHEGLQHLVRVDLVRSRTMAEGDAREVVYVLHGDPAQDDSD